MSHTKVNSAVLRL